MKSRVITDPETGLVTIIPGVDPGPTPSVEMSLFQTLIPRAMMSQINEMAANLVQSGHYANMDDVRGDFVAEGLRSVILTAMEAQRVKDAERIDARLHAEGLEKEAQAHAANALLPEPPESLISAPVTPEEQASIEARLRALRSDR